MNKFFIIMLTFYVLPSMAMTSQCLMSSQEANSFVKAVILSSSSAEDMSIKMQEIILTRPHIIEAWKQGEKYPDLTLVRLCENQFKQSTIEVVRAFKWNMVAGKIENLMRHDKDFVPFDQESLKDYLAINAKDNEKRSFLDKLVAAIDQHIWIHNEEHGDATNKYMNKLDILLNSEILKPSQVITNKIKQLIVRRNNYVSTFRKKNDQYLILIQHLMNVCKNIDQRSSLFCPTMLIMAAAYQDIPLCQMLVDKGANPLLAHVNANGIQIPDVEFLKKWLNMPFALNKPKHEVSEILTERLRLISLDQEIADLKSDAIVQKYPEILYGLKDLLNEDNLLQRATQANECIFANLFNTYNYVDLSPNNIVNTIPASIQMECYRMNLLLLLKNKHQINQEDERNNFLNVTKESLLLLKNKS